VRVESPMKALVAVIGALVIVGIAAFGMFRVQQLSSPPDHVPGPADSAQRGLTKSTLPSGSMTPWPDLNDLTTSVSTAVSAASTSARHESPPVLSGRAAQTRAAAPAHYRSRIYSYVAQHHSRTKKTAHKHPRTTANRVQ
jgi:hypothetical protein